MIDFSLKGQFCRAKRMIRSHAGVITPQNEGVVIYEIDNLDRRLILVQWSTGLSTYVSADEIEIFARTNVEPSLTD